MYVRDGIDISIAFNVCTLENTELTAFFIFVFGGISIMFTRSEKIWSSCHLSF